MLNIRKEQMLEMSKSRQAILRRDFIESLRQQNLVVEEDPKTNDILVTDQVGGKAKVSTLQNAIAVTSGEDRTHQFNFDRRGRLSAITDPAKTSILFEHDERDRLVAVTRGPGNNHRLEFDDADRITAIRFPDGASTGFAYDTAGRLIAATDRNGRVARYAYSDAGRVSQITDWQGNVTSYEYSGPEVPTSVVLPNGNRRELIQEPGSRQWKLVVNREDQATFGAKEDEPDVYEVNCTDGTWQRYLIKNDRILEATNAECTVRFEYDDQGRIKKEETDGRANEFVRNEVGALVAIVGPDGAKLTFKRDSEQRVNEISDWNDGRYKFAYEPSGALARIQYPNGVAAEFTSNAMGLPERMRLSSPRSGGQLGEYLWENDVCDRVTAMTFNGDRHIYTYDAEGRLTAENQVTYQLDANGNCIAGPSGAAAFDSANQILSSGGRSFQHDARGNMITGPCPKGDATFVYDGLSRLIAVKTGDVEAKYNYDALGRRIRKQVGKRITTYTWAGEQLISEVSTEDGVSTRRDYLCFPELHLPIAMRVDGQCRYLHTGRRAEPLCMTGAKGEILWQARYSAFGSAQVDIRHESQPWRLAGQYSDDETGLCCLMARYYNPQLGRFLTPDPQGIEGGSLNLYTYCDGDPVNRIDPTGDFAILAVIAVGAVIGAVVGGAVEAYRQHKAHPDQPLDWGSIAKEAGKGAIVGAVGAGVGLLLAPVAGGLGAGLLAEAAGGALVGGATAGVEQCADNALHDRPLFQDLAKAMGVGALIGAVTAGIGSIWANRARRAAQAAREARTLSLPASMESELPAYKVAAKEGKLVRVKSSELPKSKARRVWKDAYGEVPDGYDVDHIVQRQHGGTDDLSNLQLKSRSLNRSEGPKASALMGDDPYGTTYGDVELAPE